jgi:hypothetical protein
MGAIRAAPWGLGSVRLRCPLTAARKIGSSSGGGREAVKQAPHRLVSGDGLPSPCTPTPVLQVWRRATCIGIVRQRSTGRIIATGTAWKGIVQGTAWRGYWVNARYARTCDCPRRTGWDLQRVSHRPAGGGPYKR